MHGSLHSPDAYNFYKSIGAGERVLSIVRDGLKLPWSSPLPKFWYKNNASANVDIKFLRPKVDEWLNGGYIDKVETRPDHISPLSVDTRTIHDGTIKKRLCFDATFVNERFIRESTKLPTLKMSEALVEPFDFGLCLDLRNCYFHVKLHSSDYGKIAFAVPKEGEDSEFDFYVVKIMIYGLSPASFIINLLTKPLMDLAASLDIKSVIYIDDLRLTCNSRETMLDHRRTVRQIFQSAGWEFSDEKETEISRQYIFLGFTFDTEKMRYSVPVGKIQQLETLIIQLTPDKKFEPKFLAQIVGKIICLELAVSMLPRLQLWRYFGWIAKIVQDPPDWRRPVNISKALIQNIKSAFDSVRKYSGKLRLKNYHYEARNIADLRYVPSVSDVLMAGDGNSLYGAWYNVREQHKYEIIKFTATESEMSSSYRELLVLHRCVKHEKDTFSGKNIVFYTDSRVLYFWATNGSTLHNVATKLIDIFSWTLDNNAILEVIWKPRDDRLIELADTSSRSSTDEYSLPTSVYRRILEVLAVTVEHDLFASSILTKHRSFYSVRPTLGSSGCNALKFSWSGRICYCFPPKNLLFKVYLKIEASPSLEIVLVMLKTRSDTIFKLFKKDCYHFKSYVRRCLTFSSRVYSPTVCSKFTTEMHTWWVLHVKRGARKYSLSVEDIIHL